MALTRKLLKGMGLTDEQIDSVIDAHTETVEGLKGQIESLKSDAEKASGLQKELDALKNGKDWKAEADKIKKDFDAFKAEVTGKETLAAKQSAFRKLLDAENIPAKFHDRIVKLTDFDAIEMDGDKIKDAEKQKAAIKSDWGEYVATTQTRGADVANPPATGKATRSKAEILAIKDTAERQQAIAENHELFGF